MLCFTCCSRSLDELMKQAQAGPDLTELMVMLKMKKSSQKKYLRLFTAIDKDGSGYISLIEWFVYMRLDHSKFVERAFAQMDINQEGDSAQQLDVTEFFIGLVNFCFFPKEKLSRFVFDLYDDDKNGSITVHELTMMVEDICGEGKQDLVDKLMKLLDNDQSLDISFTEFMKVEKKASTILAPAFTLQRKLQERCMGRRFWSKRNKKVKKMLSSQNCDTLVDYFAKMLEKEMPPPPTFDEDDLDFEEDAESDEGSYREKTWEEIEAERLEAEREAKLREYEEMEVFKNEFEEFRRFKEPATGRYFWVNTKTKEELWTVPAPGVTITVGDYVRALDFTYERAYWYNKITRERFWVLPEENQEGAKKFSKNSLAIRRARGFPDPPKVVSAAGGLGRAAVWWNEPMDNDRYPWIKLHVCRYRQDSSEDPANPEWEFKGRTTVVLDDLEEGALPKQLNVTDLKELATYRFSVIYENSVGESVESSYSNEVKIITPLPEGWVEYDLPDGRTFFANAKTKGVSWDRPENDPFYMETDLFLKFSRREIKKLKALYAQMDWDQSQRISYDEFLDICMEIGEHKVKDNDKKFKPYWKAAKKDEFGEIGFRDMVHLLQEWKEFKIGQRGFISKYICCLCKMCWEKRYAPKVGGGKKYLGGDAGMRMGDWVKSTHPLVGRPFYHNTKTKETTWEMPESIRFHLGDKLNANLRRRYDEKQMKEFQDEFMAMDLDGSGAVDESELGLILENLGENLSAGRLKGLIKEIDKDGSGEVEFEEFMVMIDAVWRGKGSAGWGKVTDSTLDEENKKRMLEMKDNLDDFAEEYEQKKLDEARRKGILYPHGKYCYCGCRKQQGFGVFRTVQKQTKK